MLDSLHIKNFRCFEDLTIPSLGRVNLIVGKNNSGKSTLLEAIRLYANGGNISVIKDILSTRNDFFHNCKEYPQRTVDSLSKLFFNSINNETTYEENIIIGEVDKEKTLNKTLRIQYMTDWSTLDAPILGKYLNINFQKENTNESIFSLAISSQSIVAHLNDVYNKLPSYQNSFIPSCVESEDMIADLWDEVMNNGNEDEIEYSLRIIEPRIKRIFFIKDESFPEKRIGKIKLDSSKKSTNLKSFGEGVMRVLQIFAHAYQSRGGYLMIDEFENGLHYSIQEEVWEKLFKLAKELDIQVFATTHSEDTIKAFCKVSLADDEVDGKLISLGRSAAIADNGKILADVYDEKTLAWIVQSGMEVR